LYNSEVVSKEKGEDGMEKINETQNRQERSMHLAGWLLFVVCALFFIAAGLKNRDTLTIIGGVLFLISCILFIVPLVWTKGRNKSR
jgi:uncharacterized membrane protein YhhN